MKKIIILLLLTLSNQSFAANGSGNISNILTTGGVTTADSLNISEPNSQGYFSVYVGSGGTTTNHFYPFYKNGVAYQVNAGKTFQISKVCSVSTTSSISFQLVSDTSSFAHNATSLTSGVYQGGLSGASGSVYPMKTHATAGTWDCVDTIYVDAASTFPGIEINGTSVIAVMVLGREIP